MFWYFFGHRWRVWACLWIRRWEFRKSKEVKVWRVHPLGTININTSSGYLSFSLFRMSWFIWPCKTCLPFGGSSEKILVFTNVLFHSLGSLNVADFMKIRATSQDTMDLISLFQIHFYLRMIKSWQSWLSCLWGPWKQSKTVGIHSLRTKTKTRVLYVTIMWSGWC